MSDDNNVLKFPSHKVKKPKGADDTTLGQPQGLPATLQRRATFVVSLIATVVVVGFLTGRENSSERMPASVAAIDRRDLEDDLLLAKKIARESLREPASRGREPTAEDILRHGKELQGLYALKFSDAGHLVGLEFTGASGERRYIQNRGSFLLKHKDLLHINYDTVALNQAISAEGRTLQSEKVASKQGEPARFEVYDLKEGDAVKGQVHFEMDNEDKLIKMSVDAAHTSHESK